MKLTLNWLNDHLDTKASLDTIVETLTAIGHEVEGVEDRAGDYESFIVAEVVECDKHPNADKLNVCLVNTGTEQLQVVCGAPNVRKGLKVCFSPIGTIIPTNGMEIKKTTIRDVESNGMICSESELNLSDESNGIMELDKTAKAGQSFVDYMGFDDPVIDIALTPNRADCAGVRGLARDLAVAGLGTLKPFPQTNPVPGAYQTDLSISLDLPQDAKDACPIFVGREIRNVSNGPSPKWLADRLTAIGLRPRSALVDITNYICIGLNRPLHVFDADKVAGKELSVRLSSSGETLNALNDKEYTLDDAMTVIADEIGVAALGGVIGGVRTGCTNDTTTVFIESAYFDPDRTRRTAQNLRIESDAKYRFERGIDPQSCEWGMEVATRLILDLCGGEPSDVVIAGQEPDTKTTIEFDPKRVKELGGVDISVDDQTTILMNLGFDVSMNKDKTLTVTAPSWRPDIEGRADIVEEVLRIHGFDKIPTVSLPKLGEVTKPALNGNKKRLKDACRILTTCGLHEAITWSFMDEAIAGHFQYRDRPLAKITNPISEDLGVMRQSILPNLIAATARNNNRGVMDSRLFEGGPIFLGQTPDTQPYCIAGIRSGNASVKSWNTDKRSVDIYDAKGDMLAVLEACGMNAATMPLSRDVPPWYHPGRSGAIKLGKKTLAVSGEIHPGVLSAMDVSGPIVGFEVFTNALPPAKSSGSAKKLLSIPSLQSVSRDFAFIVDETVAADQVIKAAGSVDRKLITDVHLFDVYMGKGVEEGKKSMAITITLQPDNETLTDAQIDAVADKLVANVEKQVGGVLRG